MDSEKCCAGGCGASINAPFIDEALETQSCHRFVESHIPDSARLFHTVEALLEFPDPIFFAGFLETGRLLYENSFGFRKDSVKERGFYVEVLDVSPPVRQSNN